MRAFALKPRCACTAQVGPLACLYNAAFRGISSVGRAIPCQGIGREFEPLIPLQQKTPVATATGVFLVRPAWAHTCGCKSRCELVTVSKVKRNCVRVTERGQEAWSVNREPMNKNRIEGVAKQGEWA